MLEKNEYLNDLFDIYHALLTNKQRRYFEYYYQEDYSLNEIAELYNISRNAVYDHIKKVEEHLNNFEEKLKLFEIKKARNLLYDKLEETNNLNIINDLRKLDE